MGLGRETTVSVRSQTEESEKTGIEIPQPSRLDGNAQDPNLVTWDGPDDPENPFN